MFQLPLGRCRSRRGDGPTGAKTPQKGRGVKRRDEWTRGSLSKRGHDEQRGSLALVTEPERDATSMGLASLRTEQSCAGVGRIAVLTESKLEVSSGLRELMRWA